MSDEASCSDLSVSWYCDGQVVQAFSSFWPTQVPLSEVDGSVDANSFDEPWVKSDVVLCHAILTLAGKIDELHCITYVTFKHQATVFSIAKASLMLLHTLVDHLCQDLDAAVDRDETYDFHGSVWDCVLHVSSVINKVETLCSKASSASDCAIDQAQVTKKGLDIKINEVAKGFEAFTERLVALESSTRSHPSCIVSCLQACFSIGFW